jgi:hypothetical protein
VDVYGRMAGYAAGVRLQSGGAGLAVEGELKRGTSGG